MPRMKRDFRSRRLRSFSEDRLRFASDAGLAGLAVGIPFSALGVLCLSGMVPSYFQHPRPDTVTLLTQTAVVFVFDAAVLSVATLFLWRDRVTIDRKSQNVLATRGWLRVVRHRVPMSPAVDTAASAGTARFMDLAGGDQVFQVTLVCGGATAIRVGVASTEELAKQLESEMRGFLGLVRTEAK